MKTAADPTSAPAKLAFKGGVHFHLVVDTLRDIRTSKDGKGVFDFDAVKRRDHRSANDALRGLWRFFREKAQDYWFGERAIELPPIRVSANAVGNYVGKYLTKHLANRRKEDRRKKLVRYSKGANRYRQQFSWASPGAALWRARIGALARCCGGNPSEWKLKEEFGPRWAHRLRPLLGAIRGEPATKSLGADKSDHSAEAVGFCREPEIKPHIATGKGRPVAGSVGLARFDGPLGEAWQNPKAPTEAV